MTLIQAISWLRSARADPAATRARIEAALDAGIHDRQVGGILHATACRVALDYADASRAVDEAAQAVALDDPILPTELRAEIRALYSAALSYAGRLDEAREVLEVAERQLGGQDDGLLDIQRGALLYRVGELDRARQALDRALDRIPASAIVDRARALNNRGVVNLYLGALDDAQEDFDSGERFYRSAGLHMAAADLAHNRGMVYARMGNLPRALRAFDAAEAELVELAGPIDQQIIARAEVLVMAGLAEDVLETVPGAVARLDAAGMGAPAAEGRLYLAMARRFLNEDGAGEAAEHALQEFTRSGRLGWAAIARDELVQAHWDLTRISPADVEQAHHASEELDVHGMQDFATRSWLRTALGACILGDRMRALAALDRIRRRDGSFAVRLAAIEANARYQQLRGNRRAARRSLLAGLQLLELHRALFGATELRVQASTWGAGLAEVDIELSWNSGPARLLQACERWRAAASRPRAPQAHAPELDRLLAAYRATHGVSALLLRERDGPAASERARSAERGLNSWLRANSSAVAATEPATIDIGEVRARLNGGALVELVEFAGSLRAIVVDQRRMTVVDLGSASALGRAAFQLSTTLRLLTSTLGTRGEGQLALSARLGLERLAAAIAGPLTRPLLHARHIVVSPTGSLHAVPWSMMFGGGRVVTVTPSVAAWLRAFSATSGEGVTCIAGPGLAGADSETRTVARLHRGSTLLTGSEASVEACMAALNGCRLAHLATHAHFRSANPLFSNLMLSDGPATAYDLEQLEHAPDIMVLSGCSTGLVAARAGGDLLGLSTVLLAGGTSSLVVASLPLPDELTAPIMVALHQRLIAGDEIGQATRTASMRDLESPTGLTTASALLCMGNGQAQLRSKLKHEPGGNHQRIASGDVAERATAVEGSDS